MRFLKRQYFFTYGILGCVAPMVGIFLREQGFSNFQVAIALAISQIPALVSPVLLTLLADRRLETRHILTMAGTLSGFVLSAMYLVQDLPMRMGLFFFYGLVLVGMLPLMDGLYFKWAERHRVSGMPCPTYPGVRLWGTVGYVIPSFLLLVVFKYFPDHTDLILPLAVVYCVFSVACSLALPRLPAIPSENAAIGERPKFPTLEAFRVLISPQARWLSLALIPANMASVMYFGFIPIFLESVVGIPKLWIGSVISIGVVMEIGYTLAMPWMHRVIRLKGILILGFSAQLLRLLSLSFFPTPWVAIVVQLVHGMEVMGVLVAPVILINRLAHEDFRNSIQGVYTMTIGAVSRIIGYVLAGFLSASGLLHVMHWASVLSIFGLIIIVVRYRRIRPEWEAAEHADPGTVPASETPEEEGPVSPEDSERLLAG